MESKSAKAINALKWRLNNPDKVKKYLEENKQKLKDYHAKHKHYFSLYKRARLYGVEIDDIIKVVKKAECACQICGIKLCDKRYKIPRLTRSAHIDHSHSTGKIRGLLCHSCNVAIGHFKEELLYLELAAAYLRETEYGV